MKTLIIVPCFNESENIPKLVKDIESYGYDYVLINDNSTDNTSLLALENNYNMLDLTVNVGIAAVTRIGFKYAYENNYDCAICIDGDGQHQPKYVHNLIKAIEEGNDYAIGSRFVERKKPWTLRMLGSRLFSLLIKIKTGKTIKDPTSGMRALGKNVIKEFSESMNFYSVPDTLCYVLRKGFKFKEIQVDMLNRQKGKSYFTNPLKTIKYMISEIISIIFIQW